MRFSICFILISLTLAVSVIAAEQPLKRLDITPKAVSLSGPRGGAQLLVSGIDADGHVRDLTRECQYKVAGPARIENGYVVPTANGSGTIVVSSGSMQQTIPFTVERFDRPLPISFRWNTLAVLTKQGCNSGSCHGKPNGRGSLELSLNAFDPRLDERSLIRGAFVRFTHPVEPAESLLLKKPTLRVPHGGGKRLRKDGESYGILKQWIAEGCRPEQRDGPQCVKVEVTPNDGRVVRLGPASENQTADAAQQQIRVAAHFSDGSIRDVTRIATFSVSNDSVASVDANGLVTGLDRGQTAVVVRYLDDIVSIYLTVIRDIPGFVWNKPAENGYVDQLVHAKLRQLQYLPSGNCDNATFIRRLSLDVRGLLPSAAETEAFLADKKTDKRRRLIDRFLGSREYARFWGLRLADLLRINRETLSEERAADYSGWVFETVEQNIPYDQFVRELLTATGKTADVQAANFFRTTSETKMVAETVAQLFMGSRLKCAQCHNHPYESWTQDNYYQIASVFHGIDRKRLEVPKGPKKRKPNQREIGMLIAMTAGRGMSNPRTGIPQKPWPIDVERKPNEDRRTAFVKWLTAPTNPFFSRVAVNRIWAHLLGRGLVEPIDDFRSSNPAVNVELLDALAADFQKSGFDRKHIMRVILNSRTYQRSSDTNQFNETDENLLSHARVRLLTAEQMQDAVFRLCDGPLRFGELEQQLAAAEELLATTLKENQQDANTTAVVKSKQQHDAARRRLNDYYMTQQPYPQLTSFLSAFGQPPRKTACACERREEANLDQALQLMNSSLIRDRVGKAAGRFEKLPEEQFIRKLYLAAVSRRPSDAEQTTISAHLKAGPDRRKAVEDVIWAIINTNEFMFQH